MAAEGCVPRMNVHGSGYEFSSVLLLILLLTVDCFRLLGLSPCGRTSESGNKGGKAENLQTWPVVFVGEHDESG